LGGGKGNQKVHKSHGKDSGVTGLRVVSSRGKKRIWEFEGKDLQSPIHPKKKEDLKGFQKN